MSPELDLLEMKLMTLPAKLIRVSVWRRAPSPAMDLSIHFLSSKASGWLSVCLDPGMIFYLRCFFFSEQSVVLY